MSNSLKIDEVKTNELSDAVRDQIEQIRKRIVGHSENVVKLVKKLHTSEDISRTLDQVSFAVMDLQRSVNTYRRDVSMIRACDDTNAVKSAIKVLVKIVSASVAEAIDAVEKATIREVAKTSDYD